MAPFICAFTSKHLMLPQVTAAPTVWDWGKGAAKNGMLTPEQYTRIHNYIFAIDSQCKVWILILIFLKYSSCVHIKSSYIFLLSFLNISFHLIYVFFISEHYLWVVNIYARKFTLVDMLLCPKGHKHLKPSLKACRCTE